MNIKLANDENLILKIDNIERNIGTIISEFYNMYYKYDEEKSIIAQSLNDLNTRLKALEPKEHAYVDLGLPSGTLWATCNIGAENPEDTGLYFSFGNTDGHAYGEGYNFSQQTWQNTPGYDALGDVGEIGSQYDAATANWGNQWKMPSATQFEELFGNTTQEIVTINGAVCINCISRYNGNELLLRFGGFLYQTDPVDRLDSRGYYRTTTVDKDHRSLDFVVENGGGYIDGREPFIGFNIRPVKVNN